jgi:hypothetical protein
MDLAHPKFVRGHINKKPPRGLPEATDFSGELKVQSAVERHNVTGAPKSSNTTRIVIPASRVDFARDSEPTASYTAGNETRALGDSRYLDPSSVLYGNTV